jgi:alkylation response protein AidB-like acyl-CoA dehydrogenase
LVDRQALIERITEIARTVVAEDAAATDRDGCWPERGLRALQRVGAGGLVLPTELGGMGGGLLDLSRACEELGRFCPSTALCFGMHGVGSAVLAAKATPYQKEHYLRPIAAGEHLTTLALSEPGSGAHFYFPSTRIGDDPEGFRLDGTKSFVTNGGHADSYVVSTAAADESERFGEFSCVVVDADTAGAEWGPEWRGAGMRGNSSRSLTFDDALVPRKNLLGEPGDQIWYVFQVVAPYFLMAMAGTYLGIAVGALDDAVAHVKDRTYAHSGRRLADNSIVQHRLGQIWGQVAATRAFVHRAATDGDAGTAGDALLGILSAKAEVAECATRAVGDSMTLIGGVGYGAGGAMDRRLRDVRAAHVMSPTTDLLRLWTGRALVDVPLLSDQ